MSPQDRELIAGLCAARAGFSVDPSKAYLLESRLAPVARREDYATIPELMDALRRTRDERLIWAVVEAMVGGESCFFRDGSPFEMIGDDILPRLAERASGRPIRVWSAACGTGQEIFSLAMLVEEIEALRGARVDLFASDLSERALEKAQSGLYTQFEVQRGLPIRLLVRHFEKDGEMWAISPRLRQMVRWRRINLLADLSQLAGFDVILCRYVLSGATDEARRRIAESLARALSPGGYLILGQDERAEGLTEALNPVEGSPGLYTRRPAIQAAA